MTKWKKLEQDRYERQMEALKGLYGSDPVVSPTNGRSSPRRRQIKDKHNLERNIDAPKDNSQV